MTDNLQMLRSITNRSNQLAGQLTALRNEHQALTNDISLAKARIELKDEVEDFMVSVERQLHQKTVGRYERLLTLILQDVFDTDDRIVISMNTKRGLPAVDFQIETATGEVEDIMSGRGGSIANIISIGLRFIALSQSGLRPFVVFDEADCWLSPKAVPLLSKVLKRVSEEMNIQALVISHNDPAAFAGHSVMVEILPDGDTVTAHTDSELPDWDDDEPGVRGIYLNNIMSHHQTFIPMGRGVTTLVGQNDIGKSVAVTALKVALDGDGSGESIIRHGAEKCMLSVDMGPEGILTWERSRKGAKKVRYALTLPSGEIAHESVSASMPAWLEDMGFGRRENLDIQIGHQKKPIFLLDIPDTQRASILSVGKEASWLAGMRKQYAEEIANDRLTVRHGEKRISSLSIQLQAEDRIDLLGETIDRLIDDESKVLGKVNQYTEILEIIKRIKALSATVAEPKVPDPIVVDTADTLASIIEAIQHYSTSNGLTIPAVASFPVMGDTNALRMAIKSLSVAQVNDDISACLEGIDISLDAEPIVKLMAENSSLREMARAIHVEANSVREAEAESQTITKEKTDADAVKNQLIDEMGGLCPLCESPIKTGGHTHD